MPNKYGYGCVVSPNNANKDITTTKAYQELKNNFTNEKDIYIDVIQGAERPRPVLENLIINVLKPNDVLLIPDVGALGTTGEIAAANYRRLLFQENYVLIPNQNNIDGLDYYTSAKIDLTPLADGINKKLTRLEKQGQLKTNQGNMKIEISEDFKKIYWLYESFRITEQTACKNKLFTMSTNTFRRLCGVYENAAAYIFDYKDKQAECEKLYQISKLPKRYGKPPEKFGELVELVEGGMDVFTAKNALEIYMMDEILYKRFYLKMIGGKRILSQCSSVHLDTEVTKSLSIAE